MSPVSRRALFRGAAAAAVTVPAAGLVAQQATAGSLFRPTAAAGLSLKIVNNSGAYDNGSIHLYIVGNDGTNQCHVTPEGELKPVQLSDNGPDGYTDYAIPLTGTETTVSLPEMSGRIYVACGEKLKFKAVEADTGAALAYPAAWVESDPNYPVVHDCAEFTYKGGAMYCNTTMVDMFSVPLAIGLKGAKQQTTGTLKPGARDRIFDSVRSVEAFSQLVIDDKRVIAPGHGLGAGRFAEDYFAPYIDQVWAAYQSKDLKVTTNAGTFHRPGRRRPAVLLRPGRGVLRQALHQGRPLLRRRARRAQRRHHRAGSRPSSVPPSTAPPCSPPPTSPHPPPPAAFYQGDLTHHYAKAMHAATEDGKAYGFAFDDVGGFASYIEDGAASELTLTLTPFG